MSAAPTSILGSHIFTVNKTETGRGRTVDTTFQRGERDGIHDRNKKSARDKERERHRERRRVGRQRENGANESSESKEGWQVTLRRFETLSVTWRAN